MLKGKTAFITGTNRGIGKALVVEFARNGANIIAHARGETPEFLSMVHDVATEYGVNITPLFFDMTDSEAMRIAVRTLISSKVPVNVLINNAGMPHFGLFQMTSMKKIREIFDINLFAQMELTQLLLRPMMRHHGGCIINIGSVMGVDLPQGSSAYGLSKTTLMAFTRVLAAECGPFGLRVNAIAPGLITTDMAEQMGDRAQDVMLAQCALKRLGLPQEIAKIAVFLASENASYVNGQILRADGGKA